MNEGIIFQQLMTLTEKMAKVEQMYFALSEGHKEQAISIKDLGGLMLDIKQEIGKLDGRTEKGDVSFNLTADKVDTVDASSTTNQNIGDGKDSD